MKCPHANVPRFSDLPTSNTRYRPTGGGGKQLAIRPWGPRCLGRRLGAVVLSVGLWCGAGYANDGPQPARIVVLAGTHRHYHEATHALRAQLDADGHESLLLELPPGTDPAGTDRVLGQLTEARPTVIATVGTRATSLALSTVPRVPVVFFMVPNVLDASFLVEGHSNRPRLAGVAADVSPEDHVDWILRLYPDCRNLAIPFSPSTRHSTEAITAVAGNRGITVTAIEAQKDEFAEVIDAIRSNRCDGALMLPDPQVYNSPNVQELLLWGLRQKKPVWTFSTNVVKAGALAAQHVDNAEVGRQAALILEQIIEGVEPAAINMQYSHKLEKALNENTAERIGVSLTGRVNGDVRRLGRER